MLGHYTPANVFTGLIQEIGRIASVARGPMTRIAVESRLAYQSSRPLSLDAKVANNGPSNIGSSKDSSSREEFVLGESIAINGACHTVVAFQGDKFEVEASPETLRRTTVGQWVVGTRVNLERALRVSDRLGGHLVQGHVDAITRLTSKKQEGGSVVLGFALDPALSHLVVEKGSVALDGVSLTVSNLDSKAFYVAVIQETKARTCLCEKAIGECVNLETDVIGKYVAHMVGRRSTGESVNKELLERCGFL